jgi:hypothetical protein
MRIVLRTLIVSLVALAAAPAAVAGDGAGAAAPQKAARTETQMAALRKSVLDGLADVKNPKARVAAADLVVATWPDSAPVLDEALASTSVEVRLEAVRLLERTELGDVKDRIKAKFTDASEQIRRQAFRAARRLEWPEAEASFVDAVAHDAAWTVRQEALRALEGRGTWRCLRVVVEGWLAEKNVDRRRCYRRVLLAHLKTDYGDDPDAWRTAVDEAERKAREAKGRANSGAK